MIGFRKVQKRSRSYADAVKSSIFYQQASRSKCQPFGIGSRSVFSRINFRSVPDLNLQPDFHQRSSPQSFSTNHGPNFQSHSNFENPGSTFLSGANRVPLGPRFNTQGSPFSQAGRAHPRPKGRPFCVRRLSNFHTRSNCNSSTRCTSSFRLGHVVFSSKFPPWFPSLTQDRIFSSHLWYASWDPAMSPPSSGQPRHRQVGPRVWFQPQGQGFSSLPLHLWCLGLYLSCPSMLQKLSCLLISSVNPPLLIPFLCNSNSCLRIHITHPHIHLLHPLRLNPIQISQPIMFQHSNKTPTKLQYLPSTEEGEAPWRSSSLIHRLSSLEASIV